MNRRSKLTSQENSQEQVMGQQQSHQQSGMEFASVDEMLRHDALHTPVPPAIASRLRESISQVPAPPKPWWRRMFGS